MNSRAIPPEGARAGRGWLRPAGGFIIATADEHESDDVLIVGALSCPRITHPRYHQVRSDAGGAGWAG